MNGNGNGCESRRDSKWTVDSILQAAVAALALATIAATIVGFWLSYRGLHQFAVLGGDRGSEAWAWPAAVDLFTLAGELGVTISALTRKNDPLSWALLVAGFVPSVGFNVLRIDPFTVTWAHYAVAAVPPVSAMLALAALLRQVYRLVLAMAPASGEAVSAAAPTDAESAAAESLRTTLAAGNPWTQNALQQRFGLTYAQAKKIRQDILPAEPAAALNGNGPHA